MREEGTRKYIWRPTVREDGKLLTRNKKVHIAEQPLWGRLVGQNENEFRMDESLHTSRECRIEDEAREHIQEVNPKLYRRLYGTTA